MHECSIKEFEIHFCVIDDQQMLCIKTMIVNNNKTILLYLYVYMCVCAQDIQNHACEMNPE